MKKSSVIIMWGLITGVVDAGLYWVLNNADNPSKGVQYLGWVMIFAGLLVGTLQYRNKANGGYLTFGEGYKVGILMTLIITVITTASFIILLQIHPEFPQKIMDMQRVQMVNRGMTTEQIDLSMSYAKKFMEPGIMIIFGVIGGVLTGAIMSLLSAGIAAKKRPFIEEDNNPIQ